MARRGPFLPVDIAEAAIADTKPKPFALPDYYTPDVPDAAPNVEGWTPNQPDPRDPYGIRAPYMGPPADAYDASSSVGETLRNVAGVVNPFSENSIFGSFYQGENPVLQELARPSNYVGAGGGVRGLARGALSGIGGRVAGELAMEAVPEDANPYLRAGVGLAAGLAGGVAGYRAVDDVPRLIGAADRAINPANLRAAAPEAFQAGRVPGTDELFTFGPQGERVGPTGAVREIRLGREPRMGENVNEGLRPTNLGIAENRLLDEEIAQGFQPVIDNARRSFPRETAGMTDREVGDFIGDMWDQQRLNKAASLLARFGERSQWRFGLRDEQIPIVRERARQMASGAADEAGNAPRIAGAERIAGGADITPDEFARLAAKKAAGEALTPEEQDSVLQALGKAMGATTADEQAAAREALYNGPVPTDMREVDTGLIEGVRGRLGAPTGRSVSDALGNARSQQQRLDAYGAELEDIIRNGRRSNTDLDRKNELELLLGLREPRPGEGPIRPSAGVAQLGKPWPTEAPHPKTGGKAPASSVTLKNGRDVVVESYGDAVGRDGYNGGFLMRDAATGERMGYIDYQSASSAPDVTIAMVRTEPSYQRQGVADTLFERLRAEFPGKRIDPGMVTPDGSAWIASLRRKGVEIGKPRGRTRIDATTGRSVEDALGRARQAPSEQTVTVYRAQKVGNARPIEPGANVTLSPEAARWYGNTTWGDGKYDIVSAEVPVSQLNGSDRRVEGLFNYRDPKRFGPGASARAEAAAQDALSRARQVEQGAPEGDVLAARIPNPLPMPVRARNTAAAEAGQRVGNLLRPRGLEQLGPDATVSDVIGVAQDTRRMVESQGVAITSRAQTYVDALGPTVKDGAGNYRLRNVIKADGAPALLQDVLENPARYPLTPEQAKAVADYQALVQAVRDEPRTFGVKVRTTGLEDGQSYIPRQAAADTSGAALEARGGGAAGARLRSMREKGRVFRDPEQAARAGVVYEHPLTAFQSYVRQNLEGAANQHIASMLKTFGETSAQRVPAPLRAAHNGLMKSLQSLRQTAGRLDERALETVEAHIASGADDLNALAADLNDIVVRGSGRNAGKDARAVRVEIARIKQQIADMRPAWNRAQERARQVPAGRARVDQNAAPALIGTDFAEKDAKRISRYYANGILPQNAIGDVLRGAAKVNRAIIPMQAIGDASATLRQLGTVLPSHPITFAQNFGKAARDLFPGGQARYREWLASPEVQDAASRGLALVGEGGVPNDFHASWFSRVPVLKQAQQHFEMISNRNRVDIFNQDVDMLRRTGQRVDDAAMEQVARNANRITGVANNRATDAETLTEFAANWMRSRLETLTKAVADGGIEGQLARGYLKNYVSTGLIAAGAAAMAQGRDPREVLNPIQERNGRFSYNPNFGTVRVGGVDVDMFGSYSDLARLAVMAADAGYGALTERDLTELAKPLIYAARTKGAPWLSTGADVATGENIVGDPVNSWTYWLTKPIPINAAVAVRNEQEGKPFLPSVAEGVAQFFGARANQLTPTERVQQGEYGQMSPQQQFKAIPAQAWMVTVQQAPEQYKAVSQYATAGAFYQALVDEYTKGWIERGASPLEAEAQARASAARHPVYKAYQNARNYYENWWTEQNPEQREAEAEEQQNLPPSERRNMPRKQERQIIEKAKQTPTPTPAPRSESKPKQKRVVKTITLRDADGNVTRTATVSEMVDA